MTNTPSTPPRVPQSRNELLKAWGELADILFRIIGMNQQTSNRVTAIVAMVLVSCAVSTAASVASVLFAIETQRRTRLMEIQVQYLDLSCVSDKRIKERIKELNDDGSTN